MFPLKMVSIFRGVKGYFIDRFFVRPNLRKDLFPISSTWICESSNADGKSSKQYSPGN